LRRLVIAPWLVALGVERVVGLTARNFVAGVGALAQVDPLRLALDLFGDGVARIDAERLFEIGDGLRYPPPVRDQRLSLLCGLYSPPCPLPQFGYVAPKEGDDAAAVLRCIVQRP
jgi:hypothetical protein